MQDSIISAMSFVLAIYAFIAALLLFVAQTENYNRVSFYWGRWKKRVYVAVFNSSRRHLVRESFYKPVSFSGEGLTFIKSSVIGAVEQGRVLKTRGEYEFEFKSMEPKSAIVAVFETGSKLARPEIKGVLKGGRLVPCRFWLDDPTHLASLNILGYALFCYLSIKGLLLLLEKGQISCSVFYVYAGGVILLALGVYLFLLFHRRIFFRAYWRARMAMFEKT